MLISLSVNNYRLIENTSVDFDGKFTVLTGETGSGKTMLLSALEILSESRTDSSVIRSGYDRATISATFDTSKLKNEIKEKLDENGIDYGDETLTITKIIKKDAPSSSLINGMNVPQRVVKDIMSDLIHFSSQREQNTLLKESTPLSIVDNYGNLNELAKTVQQKLSRLKNIREQIESIENQIAKVKEENDYLLQVKDEIEKAKIKLGEDEEIKASLKRAKQSLTYTNALNESIKALDGNEINVFSLLSDVSKNISHLTSKTDEDLHELQNGIDEAFVLLNDVKEGIETRLKSVNLTDEEIDALNERDALLTHLKYKYGGTLENVIKKYDDTIEKLSLLNEGDNPIEELKKEYNSLYKTYESDKKKLYEKRLETAEKLSKKAESILHTLEMPNASLKITIEKGTAFESDKGIMMFSANKGESLNSVNKVSSGGELSRLFLAILSVSPNMLGDNTIIFDEIDTGLGGKTALKVKDYLLSLSNKLEVIAITHQGTIAAGATEHILMTKSVKDGRSVITAEVISEKKREKEIARLLSGEVNDESITLAKKMLS